MNTSAYEYDYDICEQDSVPEFPHGSVIFLMILFCLGLLGNSIVLWILVRHVKLKTMTDICLLNLAVSDLLLAASLPFWTYSSQNLPSCKMITTVYQLGFYSGTIFVTLMSVDRYLAIVHAVQALRIRTLRCGITASVIVWIISTVMAIPQVIFATLERDEDGIGSKCQPFYPEESQDFWKMRRNFSENTVVFVCLPIIIFCYVKILMVLPKTRNSKKNKAVKLIFIIVCLFVVCWVPYNVIVFLETLDLLGVLDSCTASKSINTASSFAEIIALSHCCVNPVVYAFVGEKFRKSLGGMFGRYSCWKNESTPTGSHRDTTDGETSNTPVRSDY